MEQRIRLKKREQICGRMCFVVLTLTVAITSIQNMIKNERILPENEYHCDYLPYHSTFENHNECLFKETLKKH